jgi:hypothetical protein
MVVSSLYHLLICFFKAILSSSYFPDDRVSANQLEAEKLFNLLPSPLCYYAKKGHSTLSCESHAALSSP